MVYYVIVQANKTIYMMFKIPKKGFGTLRFDSQVELYCP